MDITFVIDDCYCPECEPPDAGEATPASAPACDQTSRGEAFNWVIDDSEVERLDPGHDPDDGEPAE